MYKKGQKGKKEVSEQKRKDKEKKADAENDKSREEEEEEEHMEEEEPPEEEAEEEEVENWGHFTTKLWQEQWNALHQLFWAYHWIWCV